MVEIGRVRDKAGFAMARLYVGRPGCGGRCEFYWRVIGTEFSVPNCGVWVYATRHPSFYLRTKHWRVVVGMRSSGSGRILGSWLGGRVQRLGVWTCAACGEPASESAELIRVHGEADWHHKACLDRKLRKLRRKAVLIAKLEAQAIMAEKKTGKAVDKIRRQT